MKRKFFFVATLLATSVGANAQVNWGALNATQKEVGGLVQDTLDVGDHWWEWETGNGGYFKDNFYKFPVMKAVWNFDSSRDNTSLTGEDGDHLGSLQKATTQSRGLQVAAYDEAGRKIVNPGARGQVGKLDNYNGAGNPVIFANVTDLRTFLSSSLLLAGETYGPTTDGNSVDSMAAVVLALDGVGGGTSNRALAAYPGQWKKTAIRFVPNLASDSLKEDITFTLIPLDGGNSGNTTNYKVVVSLIPTGAVAGNNIHNNGDYIDSLYYGTTGEAASNGIRRWETETLIAATASSTIADSVTVSLTNITGLSLDELSRNRITIAVVGESDGTVEAGKYDPIVGIDNITLVDAINRFNPYNPNNGRPWTNRYPYGVRDVSLTETVSLAIAGTEQLTPTFVSTFPTEEEILPSALPYADLTHRDSVYNKNVTWESSDPAVAIVADGLVTAIAEGTTTITVTTEDGGKTATCEVMVSATDGSSTPEVNASSTKVIGSQGRIEIVGAEATVTVYSIIGQKVATVVAGDQVVPVPAGVYLVAEKNKPVVKVIVK